MEKGCDDLEFFNNKKHMPNPSANANDQTRVDMKKVDGANALIGSSLG